MTLNVSEDRCRVHARVNYARLMADGDAIGEIDVLVAARYPTGDFLLSIEDKAWAIA